MKVLGWIVAVLALVLAVGAAGFVIAGPDRVWRSVAGDPDLGPVDFARLERQSPSNAFLVCPAGACGPSEPDLLAPVYGATADAVAAAARAALAAQPRSERVDEGADPLKARFVVRTPIMGFPDTVAVEAVPVPAGSHDGAAGEGPRSSLIVYSRSQLGRSDLGVNGQRVRALLDTLAGELPVVERARPPRG